MAEKLSLPNGLINFPVFLPDATYGVVRGGIDAHDLSACGIGALVMNTYHLIQHPGSTTIRSLGGIHKMYGWSGVIVTDSGGFQAYSLIHQNPNNGTLTDKGLLFHARNAQSRTWLTPEKSIQLQLAYGADVVICLDDCTHPDAPYEDQVKAVKRTINWASRCKSEFTRLIESKPLSNPCRPQLFAVVQGGRSIELRRQCADVLLALEFDGYGYGGWPLDTQGNLVSDMLAYVRERIPEQFPLHALGIGHPVNVLETARLGWDIFDSALPTRDARQGRLYAFRQPHPTYQDLNSEKWFDYVYIGDKKNIKINKPIYEGCECPTCQQISLGFLHHLFKLDDYLYHRFATLHNLTFMSTLCKFIRQSNENVR